jgi:plasmid stabilization system protein ParE
MVYPDCRTMGRLTAAPSDELRCAEAGRNAATAAELPAPLSAPPASPEWPAADEDRYPFSPEKNALVGLRSGPFARRGAPKMLEFVAPDDIDRSRAHETALRGRLRSASDHRQGGRHRREHRLGGADRRAFVRRRDLRFIAPRSRGACMSTTVQGKFRARLGGRLKKFEYGPVTALRS